MANRFFTILFIPEKTSRVRRIILPSWLMKSLLIGSAFVGFIAFMMILDYWYVMNRISENKELKVENRRLKQQVQIFENKMANIESTMERINTFATRLKVITNIEDKDGLVKRLNKNLPDAATNIGLNSKKPVATDNEDDDLSTDEALQGELDPEKVRLAKEQTRLDEQFSQVNRRTLRVEQNLQDLYELLVDQKSFLAALPTRRPAIGYYTSGFGVRKSPYSGRQKMHEGLDIANHVGTAINATAYGFVRFAGRKAGYGRTVILDHGYGVETWYSHNWKVLVKPGQTIRRGQKVALMGSTGRSTGPHVHYEVRVNSWPVDPLPYILED